ncbi:transaldolase [Phreatobacter stygius]|uniref:Transaldolase n=1 Tax=Phreatobacter stygius TaxID=1940610 RepID=A0A4D7APL4_9HYPH|nr:transaldolase [Phreatobacter stygius]QCI63134.1 transaldolase [Phreatobacter stygius]
MPVLADLKVKLYTDGAEKASILEMVQKPWIQGFTTNPSLLKKAGVVDYAAYAKDLVAAVPNHHISFEVFSDDLKEMEAQARVIATWGKNVYVKLPVTNTAGVPLYDVIHKLSHEGVKINFTALYTEAQVKASVDALRGGAPSIISVFAGRLGDAGHDYMPVMKYAVGLARGTDTIEVIWASTREVWNVLEADRIGCHIITAPADILKKLEGLGRAPEDISLDTVKGFRTDALAAGLTLQV